MRMYPPSDDEYIEKVRLRAKKEVFDDIEKLPSFGLGCAATESILDLKKKHLNTQNPTKRNRE